MTLRPWLPERDRVELLTVGLAAVDLWVTVL